MSSETTKTTTEHLACVGQYYIDFRDDAEFALTGETSVALIRDYIDVAAGRGGIALTTTSHALRSWAAAGESSGRLNAPSRASPLPSSLTIPRGKHPLWKSIP